MGRNNGDFQQPLKVYRGLAYTDKPNLENGVGVHWSANPHVATSFASDTLEGDYDHYEPATKGVVLEGEVHSKHEIKRGTPEHHKAQSEWDVGPSNEEERTIRPGSPIRITKHHYLVEGKVVHSEDQNYEAKA